MTRRLMLLALAVTLAGLSTVPAAAAPKPGKPFEMVVAPATVPAGVTVGAYTVRITNNTGTQQLGSANLTLPSTPAGVADFTVVSGPFLDAGSLARGAEISRPNGGKLIELRKLSLPPGSSVTVTLGLRMPCDDGVYRWGVDARQSNDFSGTPGNTMGPVSGTLDTTVVGSCKLRFASQPATTLAGAQIRADELAPESTNYVTVEAVDGSPAAGRLSWFQEEIRLTSSPSGLPETPSNAVAGLATFDDLVIPDSGTYTLLPETDAAGFVGVASSLFDVVGIQAACNAAQCFTPKLTGGAGKSASLSGAGVTGNGSALLSLNLGADPRSANGCSGYTPPGGRAGTDFFDFRLFNAEADITFVMEYTGQALGRRTPQSLEVCFTAPGPAFIAKDGATADPFDYDGPGPSTVGFGDLLPDCGPNPTQPCVKGRSGLPRGGGAITLFVPRLWSGDPRTW